MPSYFALVSLVDGPLHGYAIVRRAAELSAGAVRLSTGTLYGLLDRATAEGLVVAGEPYMRGGRQHRDYALTPAGRTALQAEARRLEHAGRATPAGHDGCVMSRVRVAGTALRLLPASLRAARGEEIRGTLLDSSAAESPVRFAGEVVGSPLSDCGRARCRPRASVRALCG